MSPTSQSFAEWIKDVEPPPTPAEEFIEEVEKEVVEPEQSEADEDEPVVAEERTLDEELDLGVDAQTATFEEDNRQRLGVLGAAKHASYLSEVKPINDYGRIMQCLDNCGKLLDARLKRRERILKGLPVPDEVIAEDDDA